jgi:hypothetical protein
MSPLFSVVTRYPFWLVEVFGAGHGQLVRWPVRYIRGRECGRRRLAELELG